MNKESLSNRDINQIKRILEKQIDFSPFKIPKSDENCLIGCSALAMDIWVQCLHSEGRHNNILQLNLIKINFCL